MKSIFIISFLFCQFSLAALLPTRFVFERVVEQNPKQSFTLEQEISLGESEPLVLKETWQIHGPDLKRLTVTDTRSQKVVFSALYRNKKKMTNNDGQLKSQELPSEFVQRIFLTSTLTEFAQFAINIGVVPSNVLATQPPVVRSSQVTLKEEPFVRLARSQGTIAYAYGPVSLSEQEKFPGLWIEQDLFQIRKIRFPSKATLTIEEYSNLAPKAFMPKSWTLSWENNTAKMRIKNSAFKSIDASKLQTTPLELTNFNELSQQQYRSQVEEFYSRFN